MQLHNIGSLFPKELSFNAAIFAQIATEMVTKFCERTWLAVPTVNVTFKESLPNAYAQCTTRGSQRRQFDIEMRQEYGEPKYLCDALNVCLPHELAHGFVKMLHLDVDASDEALVSRSFQGHHKCWSRLCSELGGTGDISTSQGHVEENTKWASQLAVVMPTDGKLRFLCCSLDEWTMNTVLCFGDGVRVPMSAAKFVKMDKTGALSEWSLPRSITDELNLNLDDDDEGILYHTHHEFCKRDPGYTTSLATVHSRSADITYHMLTVHFPEVPRYKPEHLSLEDAWAQVRAVRRFPFLLPLVNLERSLVDDCTRPDLVKGPHADALSWWMLLYRWAGLREVLAPSLPGDQDMDKLTEMTLQSLAAVDIQTADAEPGATVKCYTTPLPGEIVSKLHKLLYYGYAASAQTDVADRIYRTAQCVVRKNRDALIEYLDMWSLHEHNYGEAPATQHATPFFDF